MIVTLEPDHTPPRIRIDTTAEQVSRVIDGVSVPVRGTVDAGTIYDYEAPQETPLAYDDGLTVSSLVELPDVGVWLIPPALPDLGVQVTVGSFSGWKRGSSVSAVSIPGRTNNIAVSWARGGREGELSAVVLDPDEFTALSACLDVTGPMLLSFPVSHWPAFGLVSWVTIGDVSEEPQGSNPETWIVTLPLTPVDRPAFIVDAGLAWSNLPSTWGALAATWDDLESA